MDYLKNFMGIEERSFEIIGEEMGFYFFLEEELFIIKRIIYIIVDFEYKDLVEISKDVIEIGKNFLRNGVKIYIDINMVLNGINKMLLVKINSSVICYVNEFEVYKEVKEKGIIRSMVVVEKVCVDNVDIFVFGNVLIVFFRFKELIKEGKVVLKLIIVVLVGFVGVVESKENMDEFNIFYIRVKGRKGGSIVVVLIINVFMYMVVER